MEKMKAEHKEEMIKKDDTVKKARTAGAYAQSEIQKRDKDNAMLKMKVFQIGAQQKKGKERLWRVLVVGEASQVELAVG